ncbi:MAG: adenylate/guanylate cyclase domain-containing protein [Deltaproteobacteria bacterium]|nr:adenylate/guanylate cyclase domain-containing protein [Deltaproteobacteria bacterium]
MKFVRLDARKKALLGLTAALLWVGLAFLPPLHVLFENLEYRARDYMFQLRPPQSTASLPIMIVLTDDMAAEPYGFRSPTPRLLLADVVNQLTAKGARCMGLDFLLDRPHVPEHDAALLKALSGANPKPVIVSPALDSFGEVTRPGFSEVKVDVGGVARVMSLRRNEGEESFVEAIYRNCYGEVPAWPAFGSPGTILLNYFGPPSHLTDQAPTFPVVSAAELPYLPPEMVQGRLVLVGSGMDDLGDIFQTAFSTAASGFKIAFGVELHATALGMLLQGAYLTSPPWAVQALALLVLFSIVALGALLLRTWMTLLLSVAMTFGWTAYSSISFIGVSQVVPLVLPVFLLWLLFMVCQVMLYLTESRYASFLRGTFSRYISPDVVKEMEQNPDLLNLGGESRRVTILFTDLAGFTSISERLTPHDVVTLLNEHLGAMADIVLTERGTIGAFIGDAVMAYFGAPVPLEEQELHACRSALAMQAAMVELNKEWQARGLSEVRMRIGVHAGEVIIGNVGSEQRQDYTIIGDAVNTAARLEGVNKFFGTGIIVSEDVLSVTNGAFTARELARIVVKGKTRPVAIFELLGDSNTGREEKHRVYQEALGKFYEGDFKLALKGFEEVQSKWNDSAAAYMAGQSRNMAEESKPKEWNGAVVLTSK